MTNTTWIEIILGALSAIGLSQLIARWLQKKYPSRQETVDFMKTYTEASFVHLQLQEQLKKMVDQETQILRNMLVDREMEFKQQIEGYVLKLANLQEELAKEKKYNEQCAQCIEDLNKARQELDILKIKVAELQRTTFGK
jgi:t-SNARE complex subunit (syntaxin)